MLKVGSVVETAARRFEAAVSARPAAQSCSPFVVRRYRQRWPTTYEFPTTSRHPDTLDPAALHGPEATPKATRCSPRGKAGRFWRRSQPCVRVDAGTAERSDVIAPWAHSPVSAKTCEHLMCDAGREIAADDWLRLPESAGVRWRIPLRRWTETFVAERERDREGGGSSLAGFVIRWSRS